MARERTVVGCMTGTSGDGLDAALVHIAGEGLEMSAKLIDTRSVEFGALGTRLRTFTQQEAFAAGEFARVAAELARLHIETVRELAGDRRPDLVAVHGQTVFHSPPLSWQLVDLSAIAAGLDLPVVGKFRALDVARGGAGSPITPLADWVAFRLADAPRVVVNLGGFCNLTVLPADGVAENVRGGDICVCNLLLDRLAMQLISRPCDQEGACACSGVVLPELSEPLVEHLEGMAAVGRAVGTGDEELDWLADYYDRADEDILATACDAIAQVIAERAKRETIGLGTLRDVVVAGGGARNRALLRHLRRAMSGTQVVPSDAIGVPIQAREAMAMAILGALGQDRVPIGLPQITGAERPGVAGCWVTP